MLKKLNILIKKSTSFYFFAQFFISLYFHFVSYFKWKRLSKNKIIKIELGSGAKMGTKGWTTVDLNPVADIRWDLKKGIPLSNNSVDIIYSSHLLEHISYKQLIRFLEECRRVLKINGEFSVCVPNFRLYIDAYLEGRLFKDRESWWKPGLIDTGSSIDQLNYVMYMNGEHNYMFDDENLIKTLAKAGFKRIRLREFDEELDTIQRRPSSIYAVANK